MKNTRSGQKFPCLHPRDHRCRDRHRNHSHEGRHLIYTKTSSNIFVPLTVVALVVAFVLAVSGCSGGDFDVALGADEDAPVTEAESGIGTGRDSADGTDSADSDSADEDALVTDALVTDVPGEESSADSGAKDTGKIDTGSLDTGVLDTAPPDTGTPDTGTPDTGTPDTGTPETGAADTGADTKPPPGTFACIPPGEPTWFCSTGSHCCMHPDYYGTCASGGGCPSGVPFIECNTNVDCLGSKVCCAEGSGGSSRVCRTSCGGG